MLDMEEGVFPIREVATVVLPLLRERFLTAGAASLSADTLLLSEASGLAATGSGAATAAFETGAGVASGLASLLLFAASLLFSVAAVLLSVGAALAESCVVASVASTFFALDAAFLVVDFLRVAFLRVAFFLTGFTSSVVLESVAVLLLSAGAVVSGSALETGESFCSAFAADSVLASSFVDLA